MILRSILLAAALAVQSGDVTFVSNDGSKLSGTLTFPAQNASVPVPAVLLIAGSGPVDRDERIGPNAFFADLAAALNTAGYAVLRYDKRGVGKSTTAVPRTSVVRRNFVDDAESALALLESDKRIDPKHIFIFGHSEGGELAMAVGLEHSEVRGLILAAPLPTGYATLIERQIDREHIDPYAASQLRLAEQMSFVKSYASIDPVKEVTHVTQPLLILHGNRDINVLDSDLQPFLDAAKKSDRNAMIHEFPNDEHFFFRMNPADTVDNAFYFNAIHHPDADMLQVVMDWLKAQK